MRPRRRGLDQDLVCLVLEPIGGIPGIQIPPQDGKAPFHQITRQGIAYIRLLSLQLCPIRSVEAPLGRRKETGLLLADVVAQGRDEVKQETDVAFACHRRILEYLTRRRRDPPQCRRLLAVTGIEVPERRRGGGILRPQAS